MLIATTFRCTKYSAVCSLCAAVGITAAWWFLFQSHEMSIHSYFSSWKEWKWKHNFLSCPHKHSFCTVPSRPASYRLSCHRDDHQTDLNQRESVWWLSILLTLASLTCFCLFSTVCPTCGWLRAEQWAFCALLKMRVPIGMYSHS